MEDFMLLEDKKSQQTEKHLKTSVRGSDPVLHAQNFEKFSLEEKIETTSVGGSDSKKIETTSVGGSDSVLYAQNVENFSLKEQIENQFSTTVFQTKTDPSPATVSSPPTAALLSQHHFLNTYPT